MKNKKTYEPNVEQIDKDFIVIIFDVIVVSVRVCVTMKYLNNLHRNEACAV